RAALGAGTDCAAVVGLLPGATPAGEPGAPAVALPALGPGWPPFLPACSAWRINSSAFSRVNTPCCTSELISAMVVSRRLRSSCRSSAMAGAAALASASRVRERNHLVFISNPVVRVVVGGHRIGAVTRTRDQRALA